MKLKYLGVENVESEVYRFKYTFDYDSNKNRRTC